MLILYVVFGSRLKAFNFLTVANKIMSYFLMSTIGQIAKGTPFKPCSIFVSFCMVALQEQKKKNNLLN
jgi:hypothetical protein